MSERCCLRAGTVERIRSSWIREHIERYARWLDEFGYYPHGAYVRVLLVLRFAEFAQTRGATNVEQLPRLVEPFARAWARRTDGAAPREATLASIRGPVRQMLGLIAPGLTVGKAPAPMPFARAAPRFFEFLREERGLRQRTIDGYAFHLRDFEAHLRQASVRRLRSLKPAVLDGFILESSKRFCKVSLINRCGVLRVFLRYLRRERGIARDLSVAVEGPRAYRLSSIPRAITLKEVRRLLRAVDRRSPVGKRDYAILLLLVTYGLRAREVAALTLSDIDWRRNRLRVPGRKADHSSVYPLSPTVGDALLAYLQHGRPETTDRHVFLRALAPRLSMRDTAISMLVARNLRRAGITIARAGSHTLRHTCVQRLVDADFSLKSIGDYIGHRSPQSTEIYSKVAIEPLRLLAAGSEEEVL